MDSLVCDWRAYIEEGLGGPHMCGVQWSPYVRDEQWLAYNMRRKDEWPARTVVELPYMHALRGVIIYLCINLKCVAIRSILFIVFDYAVTVLKIADE